MAAAATAAAGTAAGTPRRRNLIGQRRRIEDEGEDDGGIEAHDIEDDSITEGSIVTDDHDPGEGSDTSNIDETSPTSPNVAKQGNGVTKGSRRPSKPATQQTDYKKTLVDAEVMLRGLSISKVQRPAQVMDFDEVASQSDAKPPNTTVDASSVPPSRQGQNQNQNQGQNPNPGNRRRQEHEDYKRRRDEDPAFVPNRGAFFMHDHRHPGPSANGFRPFAGARGRGRGGRGGIGGPYAPLNQMRQPADPTTSSPWTHDMHEAVVAPPVHRQRQMMDRDGPVNGDGVIPTCKPNSTPINRTLSTEKHIGNAQVRVFLPTMKAAATLPGVPVKQYTKLPDHRPPLRRDKPVRISLPENPPRYIFPAVDRSFIFIPRAMRPNQQRMRGKPRSGMGSVGGFSRRTSVFGGSVYGSMYSPSIAMSRRSSLAQERDFVFSPTGSVISRPPMAAENPRPVVRLPPGPRVEMPMPTMGTMMAPAATDTLYAQGEAKPAVMEPSINELPQPQTHPLPQKPAFQENRSASLTMHQPRPQKNISVADIESPTLTQGPQAFQQAFHQQVPMQMASSFSQESHTRQGSYPSQHSTGTPLPQIPERAIHAAPFQPNAYGQQQPYYGGTPYQMPYYYPSHYGPSMPASAAAPAFVPGQPGPPSSFTPQNQPEQMMHPGAGQPPPTGNPNLVAQEVNGMVYYYDASQLPPVTSYPSYPPQGYQPSVMGMGGMVTPSPDGFYYPQQGPGMVYYPQ